MYVLLGAFCFAILIFVGSCVVYASRLKPVNGVEGGPRGVEGSRTMPLVADGGGGRIQVAGLVGTTLGMARDKAKESTTNAHDWVWLGRATIERNGNKPVPNRNVTANDHEMRITSNPLLYNYADPDDAIRDNGNVMVTSFDNPNSIELPSQSDKRVIDSKTYCKKPSRHARHYSADNRHWQPENSAQDDYRPPVPPHGNASTPQPPGKNNNRILPEAIMPPQRRSHSRNHKRHDRDRETPKRSPENARIHDRATDDSNRQMDVSPHRQRDFDDIHFDDDVALEKMTNDEDCARLFEFDNDAPLVIEHKDFREVVGLNRGTEDSRRTFTKPTSPDYMHDSGIGMPSMRHKHRAKESVRDITKDMIEAANQKKATGGTSPEVKRATIVGNPMFSAAEGGDTTELAIDDLEMDYEQIMHYFHNLKESNA